MLYEFCDRLNNGPKIHPSPVLIPRTYECYLNGKSDCRFHEIKNFEKEGLFWIIQVSLKHDHKCSYKGRNRKI